jgi:nucleoside-diphosphate-sugar epimerase
MRRLSPQRIQLRSVILDLRQQSNYHFHMQEVFMRAFVTGVNGYIGSVLAPYLMERGVSVVGYDVGYYRDGWLFSDNKKLPLQPYTVNKDLRDVVPADVEGCEAVVHLAELSNDPLGQNNPRVTHDINHHGSVRLAEAARSTGIRRFVYTSSCSVYGAGTGDFLDETAAPNPQTAYAECKTLVERDVGAMAGADFAPVFLRNATAYGASPRMRFDIVLNDLTAMAHTTKRITMTSDGSPWRPVVHVLDICEAIYRSLVAPEGAISGKIFNVGANSENYRVRELAEIVAAEFPGCELTVGKSGGDNRSYRVNFDKIHRELPGFEARHTARFGAHELRQLYERIDMSPDTYQFRAFTRLKQLKYLQQTQQVDSEFRWV